jgi:hypothetical protein
MKWCRRACSCKSSTPDFMQVAMDTALALIHVARWASKAGTVPHVLGNAFHLDSAGHRCLHMANLA